jgi:hypothetical protein
MNHKQLAEAILSQIDYSPTYVHWGEHRTAAFDLARAIQVYKPKSANCLSCHLKVVNILRDAAGMPPIGAEATETKRSQRLAICRGTAEDGSDACEHLAWPGLNCKVCGCFVDLKAAFKKQNCPVGKW